MGCSQIHYLVWGVPHPVLYGEGYPIQFWTGYPQRKGPGTSGSIVGWRLGTPVGRGLEEVEVLWEGGGVPKYKHYLPSYFVRGW